MVWQQWLLIGIFAMGVIANIASIGEKRKPMTPGRCVLVVVIEAILILVVVSI